MKHVTRFIFVCVAVLGICAALVYAGQITVETRNVNLNLGQKITVNASDISVKTSGNSVILQFKYTVKDSDNPGAVVQLLVAVERKVVAFVYNGIPGSAGDSGTVRVSLPKSLFTGGGYNETAVYFGAMWTTSRPNAKRDYENGGGHRGVMAIVKHNG